MSRLRSSMVLLGICVLALLIGALRLVTERPSLPTGSSYSAQPDGALALFTWAQEVGGSPSRLTELASSEHQQPTTLVVLQPELPLDSGATDAFDSIAASGGTLVVAGDSLPWLLYARSLGVVVEPLRTPATNVSTADSGVTLPGISSRYRLRARSAIPLLVDSDGNRVALRMPYKQGSLIVLATPEPFTNQALKDEPTARFVYREVLSPALSTGGLSFEERHHSFVPPTAGAASINQLLLETAPGRAVVYALLVGFVYLLLSGRRLGPPLQPRPPTETRRTMYEHVQMLASLYRRGGQLSVVQAAFSRHYRRLLAQGAGRSASSTSALSLALSQIETARSESDLVSAVRRAEP